MQRIKVELPAHFVFTTTLQVRITDLNYGGHVGNDSFLSLVHEARQQFLRHFGYTELDFAGTSLIMADSAIEYKKELNYADEVRIAITAKDFDRIGFDIYYLLEVKTEEGWGVAGKVKTGMMCFNYDLKKKTPVPAEAVEKLTSAQSS